MKIKALMLFALLLFAAFGNSYAQPTLNSPIDGATAQPTTVTFNWNLLGGATSYRIQVDDDPTFATPFYNNNVGNVSTVTIPGFSNYAVYYWHVKSNLSSSYSATWSFRVIDVVPTNPSALIPDGGTTVTTLTPTLSWTGSTSASTVTYSVSINGNTQTGVAATTFDVPAGWLTAGSACPWSVIAVNEAGISAAIPANFNTLANPSAFDLVSPANNSINMALNNHTFTWGASSTGTITYKFELSTDNTFGTVLFTKSGLGTTSYTYQSPDPDLSNFTDYYWRVTAYNEVGSTISTSVYKLTTLLPTTTLTSPANGASGQSLKPTLTWNPTGYVTAYHLEVNTNGTFTGTVIYDNATLTSTSQEISGLNDNSTYYWRVTGVRTGGHVSEPSTVWSFTTSQANTTYPANGAINIPLAFTMTWPVVTGTNNYHLEVNSSADFTGTVIKDITTAENSYAISGLSNFTVYYWRVSANSMTSEVASFTTILPTTTLSSPSNEASGQSLKPTLTWLPTGYVTAYHLEVNTNGTFTGTVIYDNATLTSTSQEISGLNDNSTYYWRVTGIRTGGHVSEPSTVWSFTTTQAGQTYPLNNTIGVPLPCTFTWPAISGADKYRIEINSDPGFGVGTVILDDNTLSSPSKTVDYPTLDYYTDYYWRVEARSLTSAVWHFRTQLPPVTITYPSNGSVGQPLTPRFTWSTLDHADKYKIQISTDAGFSSIIYTTETTNLFKDIPSGTLLNNTLYYWRICGVETVSGIDYPGAWSSRSFRVIDGAVTTPTLSWPVGGATTYNVSQQLSWYLGTPGTGYTYEIQFSTYSDFETNPFTTYTSTTTNFTVPIDLVGSTTYYWRVRSYKASLDLYSAFSTVESFITDASLGPVVPTPSWPTGGATVYSASPTLYWYTGAAPSSLTYNLKYSSSGAFAGEEITVTGISDKYFQISGLTGGQTIYWKVQSVLAGVGSSGWSTVTSFVVDNNVAGNPIIPTPSYPTSGTVYSSTPTLYWYLGASGTGLTYDVELHLSSVPFNGTPTETGITDMYYEVTSALTAGATYHWKVRSSNGVTTSAWSSEGEFDVYSSIPGSPVVPTPSYPISGDIAYTVNPTLYWYLPTYTPGLQFRVLVRKDGEAYGTPLTTSNMYYDLSDLLPGALYYWKVESFSGGVSSGYSSETSFRTTSGTGPGIPQLSYPVGGDVIYTTSPTLYWWMNTYDGVHHYIAKYSFNADMSDPIYTSGSLTDAHVDITGLIPGGIYYWQVYAYDALGNSTPSDIENFTVAPGSDSPVTPFTGSPDKGIILGTTSPVLSWHIPVATAGLTYEIQYSKNSDFTDAVEIKNLTTSDKKINGLESGVKYYWRLRSVKNGHPSAYSNKGYFIPVNSVTAINPEENLIPKQFTVDQNFPNPFNPSTTIRFGIPKDAMVSIKVYNMLGQEIKSLLTEEKKAGTYRVIWEGDNNSGQKVSSGTYIFRVISGENVKTMKMILLK